MLYKVIKPNIDFNSLEEDIILNTKHVKLEDDKRVLMIESQNFSNLIDIVLTKIGESTNENFNVIIKKTFTYLQDQDLTQKIEFTKQIKDNINATSKYSFILFIKSFNSRFLLKSKNNINEVVLNDGDLLIFKTDDYKGDISTSNNRIGVYGSITNEIGCNEINKNII